MRYDYEKYLENISLFPIRKKKCISSQFEMIEKGEIGHKLPYIQFCLPICNMCFEPSFQNLDVL